MTHKKRGIAYIPVLHKGYVDFIRALEAEGVGTLHLVSDEVLASHEELDYLHRKDRLRALSESDLLTLVQQLTTMRVELLTVGVILGIPREGTVLIMPREDINTFIADTYFSGYAIDFRNVFLRWHRDNVGEDTVPQTASVSLSVFEQSVCAQVVAEATKSADWWRQVGAALVKDGVLLSCAHNEHMPEEELPNVYGDTRALFTKGVNINYVTAAHAEVGVIGDAAKQGISLMGAELFVTDFPCPYCARLIVKSGIKKIYYMRGYAVLGGDEFFKEMGVEAVRVFR